MLLYSVIYRKSFDKIEDWLEKIYEKVPTDIGIILVGTKSDLEY